jgi:hypothetical protein
MGQVTLRIDAAPIPEPNTVCLLILSAVMVGACRTRNRGRCEVHAVRILRKIERD